MARDLLSLPGVNRQRNRVAIAVLVMSVGSCALYDGAFTDHDAGSDVTDARSRTDAAPRSDAGLRTDAGIPDDCSAQIVGPCPGPCEAPAGIFWDGQRCRAIDCCCSGPDCGDIYFSFEDCEADHASCPSTGNACTDLGGFCEPGDFTPPLCPDGTGADPRAAFACDPGACCTPCPDPGDPGVDYISTDPFECAQIDFACPIGQQGFDNECGCGCFGLPGEGQACDPGQGCAGGLACCSPCQDGTCSSLCQLPCMAGAPGCDFNGCPLDDPPPPVPTNGG